MIIERTSPVSGKTNTMDLDVTQEQLDRIKLPGQHIQNVMPHLTADQREFILTGITGEEWDSLFEEDDEDEFSPFLDDEPAF